MGALESIAMQAVWLAFNIYFEARGESFEGMVAVGHVTMNRVHNRNLSVKEVVSQPYQFSWTNKSDPQAKVIDVLKKGDIDSFEECLKAAHVCLGQRMNGKDLHEANFYFGDYIKEPSWAKDMKLIAHIGKHKFYKG